MPERGGPTTQSGIAYQNSVAAVYLGKLIDPRTPLGAERVVSVRVEAPEFVDDIVVCFSDGSRQLIQAKESLVVGSSPWKSLWADIAEQLAGVTNRSDEVLLSVGTFHPDIDNLRELCERASGKENADEWLKSLNQAHKDLLAKIELAVAKETDEVFSLTRKMRVEILPSAIIENARLRDFMPPSSAPLNTLFSVLRDMCGGNARVRATFSSRNLLEILGKRFQITIHGAPGEGLENYLKAVEAKYSTITVPGTSLSGKQENLWVEPIISLKRNASSDFDEESAGSSYWHVWRENEKTLSLIELSDSGTRRILIEAGAGFGKSTLLGVISKRLAWEKIITPAVIPADALANFSSVLDFLQVQLNKDFNCNIDWNIAMQQGRVTLLVDSIDELGDEDRIRVIDLINQCVAVFSEISIIVSARDGATIHLHGDFERYKINRLGDDQKKRLLGLYLSTRPNLDQKQVQRDLERSTDLDALTSIPLFLALLVITLPSSGELPKGRSELLERYLAIALTPQRHRKAARPKLAHSKLREGSQILAYLGLLRHEIAIPEVLATVSLNEKLGDGLGDACVEDLVQCGLLFRRGFRLGFAIATVQEYLAGCAMINDLARNLSTLFVNSARRPWAQALQFAIERADNVEAALSLQLQAEDDAFFTTLRIIGRSVANGARVSKEFRREIVDRLVDIWQSHGWSIEDQIDNLLIDGLAFPPTQKLLKALEIGRPTFTRSELLIRLNDPDLSLRTLISFLKRDDIRGLWNLHWPNIIKPIAEHALPLLLIRASNTDDLSVDAIASVIFRLTDMKKINWQNIFRRNDLPVEVRIAAVWGIGMENAPDGEAFIVGYVESLEYVRPWTGFLEAYFSTDWWPRHLQTIVHGSPETACRRSRIFNKLIDLPVEDSETGQNVVDEIIDLISCQPAEGDVPLVDALVMAASFGREEFGKQAIPRLCENLTVNAEAWIWYGPYLSEDLRVVGLTEIQKLLTGHSYEGAFLEHLLFVENSIPTGKRKSISPRGPFLKSPHTGTSAQAATTWILDYLQRCDLPLQQEALMRAKLLEMGQGDPQALLSMLNNWLCEAKTMDNHNWAWILTAFHALNFVGVKIEMANLWKLLEISADFPTYSLVSAIIEREGKFCSDRLIKLYRNSRNHRGIMLSVLYDIAPSKGILVKSKGRELYLQWM